MKREFILEAIKSANGIWPMQDKFSCWIYKGHQITWNEFMRESSSLNCG